MKHLKNAAALLLMTGVLFTNVHCKKDEETKTDLLTSGQWRVTALTLTPGIDLDGDGDLDPDWYSLFEACDKDDYYVFNANGTYESNEGATKCDPDDPQTDSGTWSFVENETKINMDGDIATIEELTKNRFRVSMYDADVDQTLAITYSK